MSSCSHCQAPLHSALWCDACQQLQVSGLQSDYFAVFGLPPHYALDLMALEQRYHALATELHPDFYVSAPAAERRLSEGLAARLNQAWQTLQDPTSRARYLLQLWQPDARQSDRDLPNGFLQEMFVLQEELEEWIDANDTKALAQQQAQLTIRLDELRQAYQQALSALEVGPPGPSQQQQLQQQLNAERYLLRLLERCTPSESNLTP